MFGKPGATSPLNSFDVYACQAPTSTQRVRFSTSKEERFNETFTRNVVRQHGCGRSDPVCKNEKYFETNNLSRLYKNHSIGSTSVTILDKSGFEARLIMAQ